MGIETWSKTANTNATADASINLRESQAPSTYNNAARGIMAGIAEFRDDIGGGLDTAGTTSAYTLTTNQGYASLSVLQDKLIVFTPHANNAGTCTLAVDGLTAKPLRPKPGVEFSQNQLVLGVPYIASYNGTEIVVFGSLGNILADNPDLIAIEALAGTTGMLKKTAANTWALDDGTGVISVSIDNNGTVIPTGVVADKQIPFACEITGWFLYGDPSGSIVIDIWKDTHANFPPTDSDSITASAPPTLSGAVKGSDSTLTGWTKAITAGDTLRFNVDSISGVTRFNLNLRYKRFY